MNKTFTGLRAVVREEPGTAPDRRDVISTSDTRRRNKAPDRPTNQSERLLALDESTTEVHAYCLMPNHCHLLLRCPDGGLSRSMERLASRYSRYANARLGRDGALFRGRFRRRRYAGESTDAPARLTQDRAA